MNVRKPVDYGTMYRELTASLTQNLLQMDEVYAIGKAISQRPEKGAAVSQDVFENFIVSELDAGKKITSLNSRIRGLRVFFKFCAERE